MSGLAVAFLLLIGGFVWGGFLYLVTRAVRSEASKTRGGDGGSTGR